MNSSLRPISAALGQAAGDLLAYNGTSWVRLAAGVGENGKVLTVVAGVPVWVAPTVYDDANVFYKDGSRNLTGVLVTSGQGIRPAANSTTAIQFQQADGTVVGNWDMTNKRFGINTTSPAARLTLLETVTETTRGALFWQIQNSAGFLMSFRKSRGTLGVPAIVENGDYVAGIQAQVFSQSGIYFATSTFGWRVVGTVSTSSIPTDLYFNTGNVDNTNPAASPALYIKSTKKVGFGTSSPTNDISFEGNSARTIWLERHTTDSTTGNNLTVQAGGCKAGQTNIGGGGLNLNDATGTGNAYGGGVSIRNYIAGVSGTSDNSQITVFQARNNQIAWFSGALVSQQSHIADPSGGATVDAEARSAINSILGALENYSLLKSS